MALYAVARRCLGGAAVLSAVALSASAPFPPAGAVDGGSGSAGQGLASDTFAMERVADTLSVLTLGEDRWLLPFPVYRFEVADVNGDLAQCGLSGSPTKVKTIQNISFQAKESKTLTGSDRDVEDLIVELLANHTIG